MIKNENGITLIELFVVIIIICISLSIAIPSYQSFVQSNLSHTNSMRLVAALQFARTESILTRQRILVCPYTKELRCGHEWTNGLLILSQGLPLKIIAPFKNSKLIWNRKPDIIEFLPSGGLSGQNGSFVYYSKATKRDHETAVILSITGRVRIEKRYAT